MSPYDFVLRWMHFSSIYVFLHNFPRIKEQPERDSSSIESFRASLACLGCMLIERESLLRSHQNVILTSHTFGHHRWHLLC